MKTLGLEFSDKLKPQLYVDSDSDKFVESYFKMLEKLNQLLDYVSVMQIHHLLIVG